MKLTKAMKENIIENIRIEKHTEPHKKLLEQQSILAMKCYNEVVCKDELKILLSLDKKWLSYCSCLEFISSRGKTFRLFSETEMPSPRGYCSPVGVISDSLSEEVETHFNAVTALRDLWNSIQNKISAVIYSITTIKKLQETWPEGEKYYSFLYDKKPNTLPAVKMNEINELLNLN